MLIKSYLIDFDNVKQHYQELKEHYSDFPNPYDNTALGMELHYTDLQIMDYQNYLKGLGDKVINFYKTFKINRGECWRTCWFFCFNTDKERFEMVEGYYDNIKSLYHFMVIDTHTGRLIDPHFDLDGVRVNNFTITKQMDIWTYQDECEKIEQEKKKKKKEDEKKFQEALKILKKLLAEKNF